jgi:TonB family protein
VKLLLMLLLSSSSVLGQSASPGPETKPQTGTSSSDQKSHPDFGLGIGAPGRQVGQVDILSDAKGVDFGPYLKRIVPVVRQNWNVLIPKCAEMMKGKLAIEFAITKDGNVADMRLVTRSGSTTLDRAAWGSITNSNPFPPLPKEFSGPYLALRFRYYYNPNSSSEDSTRDCVDKADLTESRPKTKSGIAVSISAPLPGNLEVPLGGEKPVAAIVTGAGVKENTVEWSLSGLGCSGAVCGEVENDRYHAPDGMPSSPFVTLTASAKADPTAKASVTIRIVQPH